MMTMLLLLLEEATADPGLVHLLEEAKAVAGLLAVPVLPLVHAWCESKAVAYSS